MQRSRILVPFLPVLMGLVAGLCPDCRLQAANEPSYHAWAPTPPMGWNSWDCFATTVTEAQVRAQADVMARDLERYGWNIVTVDIQWYEPNATGFDYRKDAKLDMDAWGRLLPAVNRFPSAANGRGFGPLADYVHGLGLRFGVHLLRGIPRQAVAAKTPVPVRLSELGIASPARIRDLWRKADLGIFRGEFAPVIAPHGAGLYRVSPAEP